MASTWASVQEKAFDKLVRRSLSWDYMGGGRLNPCNHPAGDWRLMPCMVIVCPVEGEYVSEIEGVGTFHILPGEALLVPAGVRHTVATQVPSVVHFAHIQFTVLDSLDVMTFFDVPPVIGGENAAAIGRASAEIFETMQSPQSDDAISVAITEQALASRLLHLIVSEARPRERSDDRLESIHRLEPALRHVEENIAGPMSRADLAATMCLSESRFHSVFREVMRVSPMAYVRDVRIRRAQFLLARTSLSIGEIGERTGYPDIFHFSRTFKAAMGVSPLHYRENLRHWFRGEPGERTP